MNHILYTKNFQVKTIGLLFVLAYFFSCSPTVYMLEHKPKFAGQLYKNAVVSKTQNEIKKSKDNPSLLENGVEELTTYAFGFLMEESDRAMLDNYSKAKELESRAHQYFSEAVEYGESALDILYEDYIVWAIDNSGDIILTPNSEDLELFYWTAAAYGGAISSSGGNPSWIIKLPRVGKLLNSIVAIDSSWNHGAALVALISFTMNNPLISSGEANKISTNLFNAAVDASQGLDMGPYLTYAESVSKVRQDKEEFIELINEALKINILSAKDFQLTNTISRNRAEWLLKNIDEFFY